MKNCFAKNEQIKSKKKLEKQHLINNIYALYFTYILFHSINLLCFFFLVFDEKNWDKPLKQSTFSISYVRAFLYKKNYCSVRVGIVYYVFRAKKQRNE